MSVIPSLKLIAHACGTAAKASAVKVATRTRPAGHMDFDSSSRNTDTEGSTRPHEFPHFSGVYAPTGADGKKQI